MEEQRNDRLLTNQWYKFYCRKYIVDKKITNSYKKAPETSPKIGSEESVVSLIMFHFRLQRWKSFGFWLCRRLQTNRWLISKNFTSSHFVILPNKYFLKCKVLDSTRKKTAKSATRKNIHLFRRFCQQGMGTPGKTTYLKGLFGSDTFLSFQVSGQYVPATRHIGAIFDPQVSAVLHNRK